MRGRQLLRRRHRQDDLAAVDLGCHGRLEHGRHEGDIFRFTLFHSIAMVLVISVITMLQAYWLKWMLP